MNSPNDKMVSDDELERWGLQRLWLEHDPVVCLNQACQIGNPRNVYGPFDSCDCLRNFSKTFWVWPKYFFSSNATTCSCELSWSPSWPWRNCNRLLRFGRPWGAVTLSRWCEGWYIGRLGARRGLKSRSTNYPVHGHHWDPRSSKKFPMVDPEIKPGTSWLVVRSSDH